MIADYFLIRGTELDVNSLYQARGLYHYTKGESAGDDCAGGGRGVRADGTLCAGAALLYDYAWFTGFFVRARCIWG